MGRAVEVKVFAMEFVLVSSQCKFSYAGTCREPNGTGNCNIDDCPFDKLTKKYWSRK